MDSSRLPSRRKRAGARSRKAIAGGSTAAFAGLVAAIGIADAADTVVTDDQAIDSPESLAMTAPSPSPTPTAVEDRDRDEDDEPTPTATATPTASPTLGTGCAAHAETDVPINASLTSVYLFATSSFTAPGALGGLVLR